MLCESIINGCCEYALYEHIWTRTTTKYKPLRLDENEFFFRRKLIFVHDGCISTSTADVLRHAQHCAPYIRVCRRAMIFSANTIWKSIQYQRETYIHSYTRILTYAKMTTSNPLDLSITAPKIDVLNRANSSKLLHITFTQTVFLLLFYRPRQLICQKAQHSSQGTFSQSQKLNKNRIKPNVIENSALGIHFAKKKTKKLLNSQSKAIKHQLSTILHCDVRRAAHWISNTKRQRLTEEWIFST